MKNNELINNKQQNNLQLGRSSLLQDALESAGKILYQLKYADKVGTANDTIQRDAEEK